MCDDHVTKAVQMIRAGLFWWQKKNTHTQASVFNVFHPLFSAAVHV